MAFCKADDSIQLEIKFHSSVREVWKAWTDSAFILKWFGSDPKGVGLKAHLDVQSGGKYEISFRGSEGIEHTCFGVYAEVREFRKLVFSWEWKSEPGVESLVTMVLLSEGQDTLMQFEHAHLGNHSMHNYLTGWTMTFEKLKRLLDRP